MEGGRSWQRGNSKNARGSSNSRQLAQPSDQVDVDPMMSSVQKSHIASILQGARTTVGGNGMAEMSRPFTPGDVQRHLFSGDDYSNRPGSSYKMKNIVGQAADEFTSGVGNQSMTTNASISSGKIPGNKSSLSKDKNIVNVLQKHDIQKKPRGNVLPSLQPIQKESIKSIGPIKKQTIKSFDSNKPVKAQANQNEQSSLNSSQKLQQHSQEESKLVQPKLTSEDFRDLMNANGDNEKVQRQNRAKMQELQQQIQRTNTQKEAQESADDEQDQYEDYFEKQMMKDMAGVENYEQQIDYASALSKLQEKVSTIDQQKFSKKENDIDEDYLDQMEQSEPENNYKTEYQDVINEISKVCSIISHNKKQEDRDQRIQINEEDILELCPRVWALADEHMNQAIEIQYSCFLETLLKGCFSLLSVKFPRAVLRLANCSFHIFLKIFDKYARDLNHSTQGDFQKLYHYFFETMKILLIYAKEGSHDVLFKEENLIPQLQKVINNCFLDRADVIISLTSQIVNRKEIINDDLVYDLVNYTVGSIKCFTQSNPDVQKESVRQNYLITLSKALQKAMSFGSNMSKKAQMLVQICGTIRNLSNDDSSYEIILQNGIITKLIEVLDSFNGHKELMLNISRILSKVSMDTACCMGIIKTKRLQFLVDLIYDYQNFPPFLIRIAFVLANITTYFEEAREQIGELPKSFDKILSVSLLYFGKEEGNEADKKQDKPKDINSQSNIEDSLVKLIRLVANLCTDERYTSNLLHTNKNKLNEFMTKLIDSLGKKSLPQNDEFIFNAISCATNLLFYDIPQKPIFTEELRISLFQKFKSFMLITNNDELQIEAARVLSNLSRHASLCEEFVSDKNFLEALCVVLDHTLRDLVFYVIGIIINITLHEQIRPKVLDKGVVSKLIDVLKDSNIEDMELAKVSAKALYNIASDNNYWSIDQIKKLDQILSSLGEELDSIMDVANEEEMAEIKSLRDMVNALINELPEPLLNCPDAACGRKFKNKEELEKHIERRHGK